MRLCDPVLDPKTFFAAVVKQIEADCILDIGSRDGDQSIFFRDLAPQAHVAAFEANPANYREICARKLEDRRIEVYPFAATDTNGLATFYVADPDSDPNAMGSSSLLPGGYPLKEKIDVVTRRVDDFVLEHYPDAKRIVLWIDVESAEYQVLEGSSKIRDRVLLIHTETALEPMRPGHKALPELDQLLKSWGFVCCGSSIRLGHNMGDIVYMSGKTKAAMGAAYQSCYLRAVMYRYLPIGRIAVYLRQKFPPVYRFLRKAYIRFAT